MYIYIYTYREREREREIIIILKILILQLFIPRARGAWEQECLFVRRAKEVPRKGV